MSRKHFKLLAEALKASRPSSIQPYSLDQWRKDVEAIADVCQYSNPRFRRQTFKEACGIAVTLPPLQLEEVAA
jgi:hypothetical protein